MDFGFASGQGHHAFSSDLQSLLPSPNQESLNAAHNPECSLFPCIALQALGPSRPPSGPISSLPVCLLLLPSPTGRRSKSHWSFHCGCCSSCRYCHCRWPSGVVPLLCRRTQCSTRAAAGAIRRTSRWEGRGAGGAPGPAVGGGCRGARNRLHRESHAGGCTGWEVASAFSCSRISVVIHAHCCRRQSILRSDLLFSHCLLQGYPVSVPLDACIPVIGAIVRCLPSGQACTALCMRLIARRSVLIIREEALLLAHAAVAAAASPVTDALAAAAAGSVPLPVVAGAPGATSQLGGSPGGPPLVSGPAGGASSGDSTAAGAPGVRPPQQQAWRPLLRVLLHLIPVIDIQVRGRGRTVSRGRKEGAIGPVGRMFVVI